MNSWKERSISRYENEKKKGEIKGREVKKEGEEEEWEEAKKQIKRVWKVDKNQTSVLTTFLSDR